MKFLSMKQHRFSIRILIWCSGKVIDIRNALLFVDDEVIHKIQIFCFGLLNEPVGFVLVYTRVVHVHMHIATPPVAEVGRQIESL